MQPSATGPSPCNRKEAHLPMVCKHCGKSAKGEGNVCPHCGASLSDVSLGAMHEEQMRKRAPKKRKRKLSREEKGLRIALIVVAVVAALAILLGVVYIYATNLVKDNANIDNKFNPDEQGDLNINNELPTQDIQNIALFGLDERGDTDELYDGLGNGKSFHSDAVIILTIDRRDPDNPRVKMSSLARDTLVYVEGYKEFYNLSDNTSRTKLTHAFDFGYRKAKSEDLNDNGKKDLTEADYKRAGAKTAIKTINANFNMNITEYMYVNFVEFMDIIDYIGGVEINVQSRELNELNKHVKWMEKECERDIDKVQSAGMQTLSGGQALAYARIRKIDSDLVRANRQRDVLKAVFEKVKSTPLTKLPDVVAKMLSLCHTTLNAEEIIEMGTWAITNVPEIINYTLPDSSVNADWIYAASHPRYGWVWIYDLEYATYLLHDFIYDTDTAKDQPKPTMPNEPKVTAGNNDDDPTTTTTTDGGGWVEDTTTEPITDPTATGEATGALTGDPTATGDPTGDPTGLWPTDPTDSTTPTDPMGPTESQSTDNPTGVVGPVDPTETQPADPTQPPQVEDPTTTTTVSIFDTP